ncbi:hypothetical protein [Microbacterium sp. SCN 69-37]|uniref:hypothetical protein n=2 Tax=Microbacterium TaxID=33882 RepID=UPI0025D11782|nr:hypothetical protein [Microbacterium sp. SCN 69-37]
MPTLPDPATTVTAPAASPFARRRSFIPWRSDLMKGVAMGFIDDAKDAAETAGRKIKEGFEDTVDRVSDKIDEAKADAEVKKAEAERDSVHKRNEIKEEIRGDN